MGVGRAWSTAGQHTAWPGRGPGIPQEEGQQVRREGGKGSASRRAAGSLLGGAGEGKHWESQAEEGNVLGHS